MTANKLKVTIHMVSSLDGLIAKKDNSVSWFETADHYEKGITVDDTSEFLRSIDCYIMGSRTYEHALELSATYGWAYGDTPTIVLSGRALPVERPNVEIFSGGLDRLFAERLEPGYRNVWLVGGAMLAKSFLRAKLAHEIRLSVLPIILGDGLPFLDHLGKEQTLHLKDVTTYKTGMVELWYEIKR